MKVLEVMKRMCASLKFIILGVTRVANLKIIIQSAARMASKNNKQAYLRNQKIP